jgi:hypothetical protein
VGDIVVDAHGEVVLRMRLGQLVEDAPGHGGREFLGREAVTAADDDRELRQRDAPVGECFRDDGDDILVERLADGARLFGTVENGDFADGFGESCEEGFGGEGPIEANFEQAQLFAASIQCVNGLLDCAGGGAHEDDDAVGVGRAVVVEEPVTAAGLGGKAVHHVLHDDRAGEVVGVAGFAGLEEDVGVLCRSAEDGAVGGERAQAMGADGLFVEEGEDGFVGDGEDFVDLVGGAEAIEEVHEGDAGFKRREVGNGRKISSFLHRVRGKHCIAGLAAAHDVGVIAEDRQRMRGDRARGHVHHGGGELACDLVHVGDHEQQALGGGERGGKCAALEGSMHGAGSAALALHLGDDRNRAPDVALAFRSPLIGEFGHGGGGRNGIDCNHFGEAVGHGGGCFVAVEDCGFGRCGHGSPHWGWARTSAKSPQTTTGKVCAWGRRPGCDREHNCARMGERQPVACSR